MKESIPDLADLLTWPTGQKPYAKQEEAHHVSAGERLFALFMEQRTGKTIVTLGTAAYQFKRFLDAGGFGKQAPTGKQAPQPQPVGVLDLLPAKFSKGSPGKRPGTFLAPRFSDLPKKPTKPGFIYRPESWATKGLDALVVIAMPSGVPGNWADEVKVRVPSWCKARTMVWSARQTESATYAQEFKDLISHEGLACLFINGESIPTEDAKKAVGTFLRARRALVVGDETSLVCSQPGNVRSRVMEAIKGLPGAVARRILDGTPGDETPLDMYSQVGFLDTKILGFDSYVAFKRYYAEWEEQSVWVKDKDGTPRERKFFGIAVDEATGKKRFRNIDEMGKRLAPVSFRVRRADCFDIPGKVRVPYHFPLSSAQREVYDNLKEEYEAEIHDGTIVSAKHALARMTRLDQVASNYWPSQKLPMICGDCEGEGCEVCHDVGAIIFKTAKKVIDPKTNPRLSAFNDVVSLNKGAAGIAWCVFDETVEEVMRLATALGLNPLRYDGSVDEKQKVINKAEFQAGHSGLFVSKEASGGRGLNLSAASWMCYVENGYSKRKRSQSEDRCEVIGRTFGTGIYDLIANDTYDQVKLDAHTAKGDVAETMWRAIREAA